MKFPALSVAIVLTLLPALGSAQSYTPVPMPNPAYYHPVTVRPQTPIPCGVIASRPCAPAQSGSVEIPQGATPDQLYQMSLQAQRRGDISAKMQYMQAAANGGQLSAMTGLGYDLVYGRYVRPNPARGIALIRAAAARNHAAAEWQLGVLYDNGDYLPHNGNLALRWISAAAAQHYVDAEDWVGINYELGNNGVAHNRALAIAYLNRAASDGQEGQAQLMAQFLSRPSTPRFATFERLVAAFQADFNQQYTAYYRQYSRGGGNGLNYGVCSGMYAPSACAHSQYGEIYERTHETTESPGSSESSESGEP